MKVNLVTDSITKKNNTSGVNKSIEKALKQGRLDLSRYMIIDAKRVKSGDIEQTLNVIATIRCSSCDINSYGHRCSDREIVLNYPENALNGYWDKYAPKYNGYEPKALLQLLGIDLNHKVNSPERINEYRKRYDDFFRELFEDQDDKVIEAFLSYREGEVVPEKCIQATSEVLKQFVLRGDISVLSDNEIAFLKKAGISLDVNDRWNYRDINFKYEKEKVDELFQKTKKDNPNINDKEVLEVLGFTPENYLALRGRYK